MQKMENGTKKSDFSILAALLGNEWQANIAMGLIQILTELNPNYDYTMRSAHDVDYSVSLKIALYFTLLLSL